MTERPENRAGESGSWQPYREEPLLTPEMTRGRAAAAPGDLDRLDAYLEDLVACRHAPVHTTVAFNSVYFGFDTAVGGYVGGPLDIGAFPSVAVGDDIPALPLGAMINVRTGGDLIPAEIIYKEGAHPDLGIEGDVPGWLSGAPPGAEGPGRLPSGTGTRRRERLVFDERAFGGALAPSRERLARLRRRGTIDAFGHMVLTGSYPATGADLDDTDYYTRYLLGRGRELLVSSLVPTPLPLLLPKGSTDEQLGEALVGLVSTVRASLALLPTVRMWGDYAFSRDSMAARLGDRGPFGRDDLRSLAGSVARSARTRPARGIRTRTSAVYTAIGPALRSLPRAREFLSGAAYPLALCHTHLLLSDLARREGDARSGILPDGVHLTLDDRIQGGGIWRAAHVSAGTGPLREPDADRPAGLGWRESLGDSPRAAARLSDPHEPPAPAWPDDAELDAPVWSRGQDGSLRWSCPMRLDQLRRGLLPLPDRVATSLGSLCDPDDTVSLVLRHSGPASFHETRLSGRWDPAGRLGSVRWPTDLLPGLLLFFQWRPEERLLRARTRQLPVPETVDDVLVEHRYDRRVATRDLLGLTAGGPEGLVMVAVRRLGLLDTHGRAMLPRQGLPAAMRLVLPDKEALPASVAAPVDRLLAAGRLTTTDGSQGSYGRPHFPPRPGERVIPLLCYMPRVVPVRPRLTGETEGPGISGRAITEHHVPGFLRQIGHLGHAASEEQRRLFREDVLAFGLAGSPELPAGFTYVRPHQRRSLRSND